MVGKLVIAIGMVMGLIGVASADTTYHFTWDHGETTFLQFASGDWIGQTTMANDSWDADMDNTGVITVFDSAAWSTATAPPGSIRSSRTPTCPRG